MTKVLLAFMLISALLTLLPSPTNAKRLHQERTKLIATHLIDGLKLVAEDIRNATVTSDSDKVEIVVIANEFTHRIQQVIFVFNHAIPRMQNKKFQHQVEEISLAVEEILYDIQRSMYDDAVKLQMKMAASLEKYSDVIERFFGYIVEHLAADEDFIGDKIREASDMVTYIMYKIFYHVTLLTETNKELGNESKFLLAAFLNSFDKMKDNIDELARDELIHLTRFLTIIAEEAVLKLEYWMNMNSKEGEGYRVVKETAQHLSECLEKMHRIVQSEKSTTAIFEEFKTIFVSINKQIKKLGDVQLRNVSGDQEYIRGLLIDNIAVNVSLTEEVEIFLATKGGNHFN